MSDLLLSLKNLAPVIKGITQFLKGLNSGLVAVVAQGWRNLQTSELFNHGEVNLAAGLGSGACIILLAFLTLICLQRTEA
jgi:hypothetical protein